MFKTLLIANRGEIACRVVRTAQRMGMRAVAVYSDADVHSLHTRAAEAIHPAYAFLSQSPEFADACLAAGIRFVGPTGDSMRLMGVKDQSKALMQKAGVPVVPGYLGERQDDATLGREADRIGYPL